MKKSLYLGLILMVLTSVATTLPPRAFADWLLDRSGTLVSVDGAVLGTSNDEPDNFIPEDGMEQPVDDTKITEIEASNQVTLEGKRTLELRLKQEKERKNLEAEIAARKRRKEVIKEKSRFEIKTTEQGGLRVKEETRNSSDRVIREKETDIAAGDPLHVEDGDGERVEIKAIGGNEIELKKAEVAARSTLPLKVGAEKNEISVLLPNGQEKEIALPDVALQKLVDKGILTELPKTTEGETPAYELTTGSKGEPVYRTEGTVTKNFLGLPFLRVKFKQQIDIAAGNDDKTGVEAGDVIETTSKETMLLRKLLERLSFYGSDTVDK